jgi:hypothetical protein
VKVTAIIMPSELHPPRPNSSPLRRFDAVDGFCLGLSQAARVPVPVLEGSLAKAPEDGFLVLFGWRNVELAENRHLCPRTILMNIGRSAVPRILEDFHLAAGVEQHRYFRWKHERAKEFGGQLYGRKDVGLRMGATWPGGGWESETYGLLSSDRYPDLPGLLAGYLAAYEELLGPR